MLLALIAIVLALPAPSASGQSLPQCSNGIDDDFDNAVDGADAGCGGGSDDDETDSPYAGVEVVTVALPVITLQGTVDAKGTVEFSRVVIRAKRGSTLRATCRGKRCPFKKFRRTAFTTTLRVDQLEDRRLKAPMTITMRVTVPGQLGKYMRYKIRRKKPPVRTDSCLDEDTRKVRPCFVG